MGKFREVLLLLRGRHYPKTFRVFLFLCVGLKFTEKIPGPADYLRVEYKLVAIDVWMPSVGIDLCLGSDWCW